ncbi:hypothetical protein [Neoroseomonas oryzicola]|uniref:Uncharacterized protein n=1 Tax=Neoroseomonas oryzicola TaxID=535904 RepID=A0A9X9WKA6_9PROT|nr:hypothetical protein [Neoroseomonas oryzicola]MBR0660766.1 hypothetical protein [Neoroseomonas oryzicola]NKE19060.1 hypothetical protein [Neoroseomonas oryzicola]
MRKLLILAATAGIVALPAAAAPPETSQALRLALRANAPGAQLVWWHAGGTTAWGNHWHAGGTGYGAYHGAYAYHGYGGAYHYGGMYRPPVPVATPWYHPGGAFAAGAVMGGVAGAAAASAARPATTTVYNYGQPPTVVNNYYGN